MEEIKKEQKTAEAVEATAVVNVKDAKAILKAQNNRVSNQGVDAFVTFGMWKIHDSENDCGSGGYYQRLSVYRQTPFQLSAE